MTSSSTFRSRSCKIKEPNLKENSLQSKPENDLESIETKSSCEPSSTRISWKTSKIFSRTLSSIEVIRAMKSNKQNHQHHSQSNQNISVSPTKPSVIVTATGDSAISTSILPASKASSRHEVTSHSLIIKDHPDGAILSENNETTSGVVRTRSGNSKAASEWKVLKNKLSSLRKRSTGSSSGPRGDGEESLSASTSPGPGDGEGEGRRLSSNSRTGSARTSRSGSQDEGIVCKREDLINLLTEATKVASSTTSITANSPPPPPSSTPTSMTTTTSIIKPSIMKSDQLNSDTSPTSIGPRKVILKTSSVYNSVVQVTGAENIDTTRKLMKKSALKKNPAADSNNNYNNNSNNNNATHNNCNNSRPNSSTGGSVDSQGSVEFIETRIVVPSKPSLKFDLPHEKETRSRQTKAIQFKEADNSPAAMTTAASSSSSILTSPSSSTATTTLTKTCDSQNTIGSDNELTGKSDKKILIEADNQDSESSPSVAAVKWDESNVVDAMILGDAIQAFLRGMGGSSEKTEKPPEKRVLFKKLS